MRRVNEGRSTIVACPGARPSPGWLTETNRNCSPNWAIGIVEKLEMGWTLRRNRAFVYTQIHHKRRKHVQVFLPGAGSPWEHFAQQLHHVLDRHIGNHMLSWLCPDLTGFLIPNYDTCCFAIF